MKCLVFSNSFDYIVVSRAIKQKLDQLVNEDPNNINITSLRDSLQKIESKSKELCLNDILLNILKERKEYLSSLRSAQLTESFTDEKNHLIKLIKQLEPKTKWKLKII